MEKAYVLFWTNFIFPKNGILVFTILAVAGFH